MKGALVAIGLGLVSLAALPVHAGFSQAHLARLLRNKVEDIRELAANAAVVRTVQEHNAKAQSLEEIKRLDEAWVATAELTPFKKSLQDNEVGRYFKTLVDFNRSIYSELFLTDRNGATLAAYPATTDYWQGDEKKWSEAFNGGSGEVYIGPVAFDESSHVNSVQISVPVVGAENKAIGVLVVGVKLSYLQAKYLRGHGNGEVTRMP